VIFTVVALARNQPIGRNGLFILSLLSLLAFREEINFVAGVTPKLESNKQIGELAKQTQPQLAQPLNRIAIDVSRNGLLMSSAGGLQTINGYGFPLRSFSQTVQAMMDRPYRPTTGFAVSYKSMGTAFSLIVLKKPLELSGRATTQRDS
jgi:hypothetical protein